MDTCRFLFALLILWINVGAAEPVTIGAIASLTGPAGEQGLNWVDGARLAAEDLTQEGYAVNLLVEDDGTAAAKAASAFQKLASAGARGMIGGTWDFLAEAIYPLALRTRIPLVTPGNPEEVISPQAQRNPFVFTLSFSLASAAPVISDFLKHKSVKRIALVYPDLPFGAVQAELVELVARQLDIEITFRSAFPMEGYLDGVKISALKISRSPPDLVFIVVDYSGLDLFLTEMERLGVNLPVMTTQHLDQAALLANNPQRFRQTVGLYPASIMNESFRSRFLARYQKQAKVYAAEGYDAVRFLHHVINSSIDVSKNSSFSIPGVTGPVRFVPGNRALTNQPPVMVRWSEGKLVLCRN